MFEKANTFNQRRSANDSVLWIARVGFRKLNRPNRDLLSDWEDLHVRGAPSDKGIGTDVNINSIVLRQPFNLPKADGRKSRRP
jgi:hypothetical protein